MRGRSPNYTRKKPRTLIGSNIRHMRLPLRALGVVVRWFSRWFMALPANGYFVPPRLAVCCLFANVMSSRSHSSLITQPRKATNHWEECCSVDQPVEFAWSRTVFAQAYRDRDWNVSSTWRSWPPVPWVIIRTPGMIYLPCLVGRLRRIAHCSLASGACDPPPLACL